MASKKPKTTHEQYEILVQYIENHPQLKSNKLTNNFTAKDRSRLWEDLAECLNSVKGPHKDVQKWQKTWTDFKHITLKTARMRRKLLESSGSFTMESFEDELSPLQLRVLNVIGWNEAFGSIEEGNFDKESLQSLPSPNEAFFPIIEEHSYSENDEQMYECEEMDDDVDDTESNIELFSITKYSDREENRRREENTVINRMMQQQSEILEKISQQHKQILDTERKEVEREKNNNSVNVLLKQQNKLLEKIAMQLELIANAEQVKKEENNNSINVLLEQQNKLLEKIAGQQERIADAEHRKADTLPELSNTIKELLKKT